MKAKLIRTIKYKVSIQLVSLASRELIEKVLNRKPASTVSIQLVSLASREFKR